MASWGRMQQCVPLFSYKPTISLETREIQKSTVHTLSIALSRGGKSPFPLHCWPRWILDGHLGICWIFQWQADHIQRGLGRCNAKVAAQISKTLWGWVKRSRSHHYWPSVTIQNWRGSSSFYFLGNSIEHCNCSSSRSSTVECEMSVKSHQKRALPLWLPLPLVHYPNRGECTPIQVFTHHGKLGTTFWGNGAREPEETKRTKENRSEFHNCLFKGLPNFMLINLIPWITIV